MPRWAAPPGLKRGFCRAPPDGAGAEAATAEAGPWPDQGRRAGGKPSERLSGKEEAELLSRSLLFKPSPRPQSVDEFSLLEWGPLYSVSHEQLLWGFSAPPPPASSLSEVRRRQKCWDVHAGVRRAESPGLRESLTVYLRQTDDSCWEAESQWMETVPREWHCYGLFYALESEEETEGGA